MPALGMLQGKSLSIPMGKLNIWFTISPPPAVEKAFSNPASAPGFDLARCCCCVQTVPDSGNPDFDYSKQKCKAPIRNTRSPLPQFAPNHINLLEATEKEKPCCFFCEKQNCRGWGWQSRIWPSMSMLEPSRRQQAATGWMSLGSRVGLHPRSPLPGEGGRGKLLILGQVSRGFWPWQGGFLKGDFTAGPFHASLSREFTVTPSQATPGASSRPRPQSLILPFRVMQSFAKLTLKRPNLAF